MRNSLVPHPPFSTLLAPPFAMKQAQRSAPCVSRGGVSPAQVKLAISEPGSAPAFFARAFEKLDLERRARLLGRLLGSVGPLALVVVGGGQFAKYLRNARSSKVPVSLEDAAHATPRQVYDVVRYVEQSNPRLVERLLVALWQDRAAMTVPCA